MRLLKWKMRAELAVWKAALCCAVVLPFLIGTSVQAVILTTPVPNGSIPSAGAIAPIQVTTSTFSVASPNAVTIGPQSVLLLFDNKFAPANFAQVEVQLSLSGAAFVGTPSAVAYAIDSSGALFLGGFAGCTSVKSSAVTVTISGCSPSSVPNFAALLVSNLSYNSAAALATSGQSITMTAKIVSANSPTTIYENPSSAAVATSSGSTVVICAVNATCYTLQTPSSGSGSGVVTASPASFSQSGYVSGTVVTLTAAAAGKSVFTGWSGACSGMATTCIVTMNSNQTAAASFQPGYVLSTSVLGGGRGIVTPYPTGPVYLPGTIVSLTASPAMASTFAGWQGACIGPSLQCQITITADQSVAATFNSKMPLRVGAVFSTAQPNIQSFLRFHNMGVNTGTVTVALADYDTGQPLGEWTSPSIPPGAEQQFAIGTIESGAKLSGAKPTYYSISINPQIDGLFQHVLWRVTDGTLTNLSTCDSGVTADAVKVSAVHSSLLAAAYPSSIVVNNTGTTTATVSLGLYDARDGAKLGSYKAAPIPASGQVMLPVATIESGVGITPGPAMFHYVVKAEGAFTGFLQHLVNNLQAGVITDMTTGCALAAPQ